MGHVFEPSVGLEISPTIREVLVDIENNHRRLSHRLLRRRRRLLLLNGLHKSGSDLE
jgi:hypothetical protein